MAVFKSIVLVGALAGLVVCAIGSPIQRHQRKYSYALVTKNGNSTFENWDGNDQSISRKGGPDRLYVKKDGKLFIITDSSTIAQMKKAMEPMMKIAAKQSAVGDQQSKIGDEQTKIGDKQSKLGDEMSKIGEKMGEVGSHQGSDGEMQKLQDQMNVLQKQMDELNKQMSGPSQKQDELSRKQSELGRQQDKASAEAEKKIDHIIDDAFAHGLAKPS